MLVPVTLPPSHLHCRILQPLLYSTEIHFLLQPPKSSLVVYISFNILYWLTDWDSQPLSLVSPCPLLTEMDLQSQGLFSRSVCTNNAPQTLEHCWPYEMSFRIVVAMISVLSHILLISQVCAIRKHCWGQKTASFETRRVPCLQGTVAWPEMELSEIWTAPESPVNLNLWS